ncbi:sigma 54-dependent transcriptional activator [Hahella chejuensis KCTC 2396]|uniref:Sigma 54-dependent transcriptional activator n=1 Tax=Hahella chejuensis (strain KCTC 2396) TaxID=349521 RepID=Q2SCB1_HAHCH|nr:sigma 54-interacting transcriptional regulator [Hahella chejuensis]ABC31713.1 sigma 54-dependent transcriptional activator [Hahella chejuensis KCTC 2396]
MSKAKPHTLVSWIGGNDLKSTGNTGTDSQALGPLAATLKAHTFDAVELLYNYPEEQVQPYLDWLQELVATPINAQSVSLTSPVNFDEIYIQTNQHLAGLASEGRLLSILLSPGTPAMQAVWILLGKTRYPCRFYQSSKEQGVQEVDIPFELSVEYVPAVRGLGSAKINQLSEAAAPIDAAFDDIITRNPRMLTLKAQAQILAQREVPILIYGETGTGKELFARAIHNASGRAGKPFIALNCGAIPPELVDSVLFGHLKGAFTGAVADKSGVFQQADGGTLFLDEFGELESAVQVRLLRVLQEGTYLPVGGTKEQKVDIRLITATHRNLLEAVANGTFREDLFYRVAVGVLHLPPLREREGDLSLLAEALLASFREQDVGLEDKKLSAEAKNLIFKQPWRGNVRELQSSLLRSALWCQGDTISADDIRQSLFQMPEKNTGLLDRDVNKGVDIQELCDDLMRHYIPLALEASQGKKTKAAQLLGMNNYQTLENKMKKLNMI